MSKQWLIAESAPPEWHAQFPELPFALRHLLWHRGIRTQEAVDEFLNPDYGSDLHDPFLFRDMKKAVERVLAAVEAGEPVGVFGDYDADGVTGAAILVSTLRAMGATTEIYLPHREKEGYGLNKNAVQYFHERGVKLIITCDCGIASVEETALAQSLGMAVIITDHHTVPEKLPEAFAILHPLLPDSGYPYGFLTGGGVAFKFACALVSGSRARYPLPATHYQLLTTPEEGFEKWLLDLVAISTVADVGKLIGENRTLVKYGLIVLQKTRRMGLRALYELAGITPSAIDAWAIAFQITPRINAAGRMDHANAAYELLMSETPEDARRCAEALMAANTDRQKVTEQILDEAKRQIGTGEGKFFLSAYHEGWPLGVVGLAAGKLAESYGKPVLLACKTEMGHLAGSIRSVKQFDVMPALRELAPSLLKFGGHPMAAGFSATDTAALDRVRQGLDDIARAKLAGANMASSVAIDMALPLADVGWDLWSALAAMEPFGEGNPRPKFVSEGVRVMALDRVGNGGKHLRITVADEKNKARKMIGFCFADWCERLEIGDRVDVAFELGVNEWNGNRELQLKIVDLRLSEKEG